MLAATFPILRNDVVKEIGTVIYLIQIICSFIGSYYLAVWFIVKNHLTLISAQKIVLTFSDFKKNPYRLTIVNAIVLGMLLVPVWGSRI